MLCHREINPNKENHHRASKGTALFWLWHKGLPHLTPREKERKFWLFSKQIYIWNCTVGLCIRRIGNSCSIPPLTCSSLCCLFELQSCLVSIARGDGWLNLREEGLRNALSVFGLQTDTLVKRRDTKAEPLCRGKGQENSQAEGVAFVVEEMMVFLGWVVTCLPSSPGSHSLTFLLSYWAFTFLYAVSPQLLVMIVLWLPYPFSLPWAISWTCPVCLIHCSFPF